MIKILDILMEMYPPYKANMVKKTRYKASDVWTNDPEIIETSKRIPRKPGQPAGSNKHSDLYTDEDPKGTITGLGFKDAATSKAILTCLL